MFLKLNQNLEIIAVSENLLNKFNLAKGDLLGLDFLDMVLNTVPHTVIDDLKRHCKNGLNGSYILHIRINEKVCWLNVKFDVADSSSLGSTFEVRFFQLDNLSVRNAKDMYALMSFEELTEFEQQQSMMLLKSDDLVYCHGFK